MILCTIRMDGNSWVPKSSMQVFLKARNPDQTQRQNVAEVPKRYLRLLHWTQNCVELMGLDNETLLGQTIYFGWYDGIKHPPSPADQFPDHAGIVKHDARYSSLVKKTTFTQKWVKPLPKIGEQFHACVSCQERWGRETLPHAVTNRYPIPYRITDAERFVHRFAGEKGKRKEALCWAIPMPTRLLRLFLS